MNIRSKVSGERLKIIRNDKKLTQAQLIEMCNKKLNKSYRSNMLSKLETGRTKTIDYQLLKTIAKILNISIKYLQGGTNGYTNPKLEIFKRDNKNEYIAKLSGDRDISLVVHRVSSKNEVFKNKKLLKMINDNTMDNKNTGIIIIDRIYLDNNTNLTNRLNIIINTIVKYHYNNTRFNSFTVFIEDKKYKNRIGYKIHTKLINK